MNKVKFEQTEKQISASEISEFEEKYNLVLPDSYKKLILKYNGGYTENSSYFDTLSSIKYGKITVEYDILIHQTEEENIPTGYFPFASDASDNIITICLEGDDKGKIVKFYFDTEEEHEIIANSLEELLGVESIDEL